MIGTLEEERRRMRIRTLASLVAAALLIGCADMTSTQQRTMSGAAIGTAGGALIGAIGGNTAMGAVIGAAAGATGGYIWDQHKQAEQRAYERGVQEGKASAGTQ
jgi:uncharacterized membrane protein